MNEKSLRVLHVIPSLAAVHGGPTRALELMEYTLVERGVNVETVTTDDDGPGRRNGKQYGAMPAETGATRRYFPKRIEFYKVSPAMAWWLFRHVCDYDMVHIHALFSFSSMAAAWAARLRGVPYVLRPLGTLTRYSVAHRRPWLKRLSLKWIEGPLLRDAAAVHFTSFDEQREAAECGVKMRGVVIPLGIDTSPVTDDALVRSHFLALQGSNYILFLSRLDLKKNVEGLLHAFKQCHAKLPNTKLLIAGDGSPDYVASLVALATTLELDKLVIWAGHIQGELKSSVFAGAKLFVLPSFSENFGIAVAEALMAGLPCVLGLGVAIASDVVESGAGIAVEPDPASIAQGINALLASSVAEHARMSANASELARDKFSVNAMGRNLVALYESVSSSNHSVTNYLSSHQIKNK